VKPIILLIVVVGVGSALIGSMAIQFFAPTDNNTAQLDLQEKCEKIAAEGFKIQVKYSEIDFDKMPMQMHYSI
jgi:hypothetical protein